MVGANLSASVTGVGSSLAAATLVGSGLYPYPYPVAGRTWLGLAGADRTIRAQPEPAGPFPRFRYAVPSLISRARFVLRIAMNAAGRHPYWHPYVRRHPIAFSRRSMCDSMWRV